MNNFLLKHWGSPIVKYTLFLIYGLRIIIPFFIFQYPVFSLISEYLLDYGDSLLGFYSKAITWKHYYKMDKYLDYWFYIFVLIYCYRFSVFPIVLILFIYRSIGQILTIKSYKEQQLVWFANFFDLYFMAFVLSWYISSIRVLFEGANNIILLILIAPIAFGREYIIHVKKPLPKVFRKSWLNWKDGKS